MIIFYREKLCKRDLLFHAKLHSMSSAKILLNNVLNSISDNICLAISYWAPRFFYFVSNKLFQENC